jgi:hypothetical protein
MNTSALNASPVGLDAGTAATRRLTAHVLAFGLVAMSGVHGLSTPSQGQTAPAKAAPVKEERGLEGSWSGGGSVSFASGGREQARCRAHYSRRSKTSYALNATCATASGKATQTATLHKIGENKYSGNFHNADYDISGTISVVVNGNSQSVRLTSSSGWAVFRLSR